MPKKFFSSSKLESILLLLTLLTSTNGKFTHICTSTTHTVMWQISSVVNSMLMLTVNVHSRQPGVGEFHYVCSQHQLGYLGLLATVIGIPLSREDSECAPSESRNSKITMLKWKLQVFTLGLVPRSILTISWNPYIAARWSGVLLSGSIASARYLVPVWSPTI